jgi:small subunit ribosomal protein S1
VLLAVARIESVKMQNESSSPKRSATPTDDSYWAALFAQEEAELSYTPVGSLEELEQANHNGTAVSPLSEDPWQHAWAAFAAAETIELGVTGFNKGGLLVNYFGIPGFVPASQLIDFPQFHLEIDRINALRPWQDKQLRLRILEVDAKQNRLILSERAALVKADERERLLNKIAPGAQVEGQVTNLTNFGAFVELGGLEGLIHISELSWSRVTHPGEILQPGEQVRVRVLSVDADNGRVALSLKRLKKDPWKTVADRYQPGQLVEGIVSKIENFGAFVQIEEELEGLIHISELAEGTFLHPRNVVQHGQQVQVRVLHVDGPAKRLALSLRGVSS